VCGIACESDRKSGLERAIIHFLWPHDLARESPADHPMRRLDVRWAKVLAVTMQRLANQM